MAAIDTAEVNRLLEATTGKTAYTAPTTPLKLRLYTNTGSDGTAATTQVAGGSYAPQNITWAAAAARAIANDAAINFTGMPATTVQSVEVYDNNGTPRRILWGPLASSKTVDAGDTLSFAIGAIVLSIT